MFSYKSLVIHRFDNEDAGAGLTLMEQGIFFGLCQAYHQTTILKLT